MPQTVFRYLVKINMRENITIVTPSYGEFKSIPALIKKIRKILPKAEIVIVDDSPKDENLMLKTLLKKEKNVKVISRFKKLGRGSAVLAGFKEAFKNKTIEYFFEMDSDLAHDPKEIPRFLAEINKNNFDVVLGSRYIKGGKTINIVLSRIILSKIINLFLHLWLNIKLTDFTGGFRIYNRRAIEFLSSIELKSKGFIMLSEIIFLLHKNDFKIGEVPITVSIKKDGKSNADVKEFADSLSFIIKMRLGSIFEDIYEKFKKERYTKRVKVIILISIFLFSVGLRLLTLNQIGRTWDEFQYIEQGYKLVELIKKGDLDNSFFYTTYDHPPLVKYLYGITAHFDVERVLKNTEPVFRYDYTFSRILSAAMFSIGVLFTVLIGWKLFSPTVGMIAGIILSMLPVSLGLSQLVTTESLKILIYPLTIYSYIDLIKEKITKKSILFAGIATGFALQAKQTNFLLIILLGIIFFLQYKKLKNNYRKNFLQERAKIIFITCIISILVFIIIWPQLIFHLKDVWEINQRLWNPQFSPKIWQITLAPPEFFLGRLMLAPIFYYFVYFFISIPALILVLFFLGLKNIVKNKNIYSLAIMLWFLLPFSLSIYSWRQHGLRYIIEIYPAIALISALGFNQLVSKFTSNNIKKLFYFTPILIYLFLILYQIKPYYLDYFNELVGGINNVYNKKLFQIGWWGQGIREAGYFLKNTAPHGSKIGIALAPPHVFPILSNYNVSIFNPKKKYDYVIVNDYAVLRYKFDDKIIKRNYRLTYIVTADKAVLVSVYRSKTLNIK